MTPTPKGAEELIREHMRLVDANTCYINGPASRAAVEASARSLAALSASPAAQPVAWEWKSDEGVEWLPCTEEWAKDVERRPGFRARSLCAASPAVPLVQPPEPRAHLLLKRVRHSGMFTGCCDAKMQQLDEEIRQYVSYLYASPPPLPVQPEPSEPAKVPQINISPCPLCEPMTMDGGYRCTTKCETDAAPTPAGRAGDSFARVLEDMRTGARAARSNGQESVAAFVGQWADRLQSLGAQPAGWQLAPVEPTRAMQDAAEREFLAAPANHGARTTWADRLSDVYRAMLAASPPSDSAGAGEKRSD